MASDPGKEGCMIGPIDPFGKEYISQDGATGRSVMPNADIQILSQYLAPGGALFRARSTVSDQLYLGIVNESASSACESISPFLSGFGPQL